MRDKRRHERSLTLKTAKIVSSETMATIDCAIFNISAGGACILVPDAAAASGPGDRRIESA